MEPYLDIWNPSTDERKSNIFFNVKGGRKVPRRDAKLLSRREIALPIFQSPALTAMAARRIREARAADAAPIFARLGWISMARSALFDVAPDRALPKGRSDASGVSICGKGTFMSCLFMFFLAKSNKR